LVLSFDSFDGVRSFNIKSDGVSWECLDKYLNCFVDGYIV